MSAHLNEKLLAEGKSTIPPLSKRLVPDMLSGMEFHCISLSSKIDEFQVGHQFAEESVSTVAVVVLLEAARAQTRPGCNLGTRQAARYTSGTTARKVMNNVSGTGS